MKSVITCILSFFLFASLADGLTTLSNDRETQCVAFHKTGTVSHAHALVLYLEKECGDWEEKAQDRRGSHYDVSTFFAKRKLHLCNAQESDGCQPFGNATNIPLHLVKRTLII